LGPVRQELDREYIELVKRFENYLKGEKRAEQTISKYCQESFKFLRWTRKSVSELQRSDTQAYKEHLASRYCENSMATILAAVNVFCERVLDRPELKQRPPRNVVRSTIPLTEDEVKRILEAAREPPKSNWPSGGANNSDTTLRDYAMMCLLYYGGVRRSEVISLHISDIDFDSRKIRIHSGKGKDWSKINLHPAALEAILQYMRHGRPEPRRPECHDVLFLSNEGRGLSRNVVWDVVKKCAARAGIKKRVYPHLFRHSLISHMAEKGISAPLIQAQSRHHSLDMLQRYIHPSDRAVSEAYRDSITVSVGGGPRIVSEPSRAHSEHMPDDVGPSSQEERRNRVIDLFVQGRISEQRLDKLLALLEGDSAKAELL